MIPSQASPSPPAAPTIAIFGATGGVGRAVLASALGRGYRARLLVRTPSALPADIATHPSVTVVAGDAAAHDRVRQVLEGAQHVVNALGGPKGKPAAYPTGFYSRFLRDLIGAMRKVPSIETYVHVSACLAPHPDGTFPLRMRLADRFLGRAILGIGPNTDEHAVEQKILAEAGDLPFAAVCLRPGGLREGPGGTALAASDAPTGLALGMVAYADLGEFILGTAVTDEGLRGTFPYVVVKRTGGNRTGAVVTAGVIVAAVVFNERLRAWWRW